MKLLTLMLPCLSSPIDDSRLLLLCGYSHGTQTLKVRQHNRSVLPVQFAVGLRGLEFGSTEEKPYQVQDVQ